MKKILILIILLLITGCNKNEEIIIEEEKEEVVEEKYVDDNPITIGIYENDINLIKDYKLNKVSNNEVIFSFYYTNGKDRIFLQLVDYRVYCGEQKSTIVDHLGRTN